MADIQGVQKYLQNFYDAQTDSRLNSVKVDLSEIDMGQGLFTDKECSYSGEPIKFWFGDIVEYIKPDGSLDEEKKAASTSTTTTADTGAAPVGINVTKEKIEELHKKYGDTTYPTDDDNIKSIRYGSDGTLYVTGKNGLSYEVRSGQTIHPNPDDRQVTYTYDDLLKLLDSAYLKSLNAKPSATENGSINGAGGNNSGAKTITYAVNSKESKTGLSIAFGIANYTQYHKTFTVGDYTCDCTYNILNQFDQTNPENVDTINLKITKNGKSKDFGQEIASKSSHTFDRTAKELSKVNANKLDGKYTNFIAAVMSGNAQSIENQVKIIFGE